MYSSAKIDLLTCRALSERIILRLNFLYTCSCWTFHFVQSIGYFTCCSWFFRDEISKEIKHKCR